MPLPDYSFLEVGTPLVWASGQSLALNIVSLANDAAREGNKSSTLVDGTKGMPELLEIAFESAVASAATDGKEIEVYIAESHTSIANSGNPSNLQGSDAALSNPDELKFQSYYAGRLRLSNARGTNMQFQRFTYVPTMPYIIPLVVNKSGQALKNDLGVHRITITPMYRKVTD